MPEPRDVTYLVPADVLAKVNTAVVVLENYGQAVTEALRQLDRTTTVAWKAVNLIEVTDDEWQLVKRTIDRGWDAAGAGSQDGIRQGLALRRLPGPQQSLLGEGGGAFRLGLPTPVGLHTVQLGRDGVLA